MDIFDDTILEIKDWFEKRITSGRARTYCLPEAVFSNGRESSGTALQKAAPAGIILKEDTHVELGHPSAGSCSASLATRDARLVSGGRITLVGPDIVEAEEKHMPFCQVLVASMEVRAEEDAAATARIDQTASRIDRVAHAFAQDDGYMIRSVPNLIWARVSKSAARQGFSFRQLGERLACAVAQHCDQVTCCDIYFATSCKQDIAQLDALIDVARAKTRKLETFERGADGTYECTQEEDCSSCSEQVVCDNIRDVINIRKGDRVVTVENGDVTVRKRG